MTAPLAISEPAPAAERVLDPTRLGDHLDRLYRAAWGMCGQHQEAEDLVQETYARVLARPRLVRRDDDLGYLLRALRNTHLNGLAAKRCRPATAPLIDSAELAEVVPIAEPEAAAADAEVLALIGSLPAPYRDVLVAVDLVGLTYPQAARALRVRVGTVRSRLHRARRAFLRLVDPN